MIKQTNKAAPYTHYLEELAKLLKLNLTKEQINNLKIITNFNIAGRYDNVKFAFYKQCTKFYTEKYFNISKELYLCLKKEFQKK